MHLLDELWRGKVTPDERAIREGSTYEKINRESIAVMRTVLQELSKEGEKAFDQYCQLEQQLSEISERDTFIRGVRIGARFILDILGEYDSQLPQVRDVYTND